MRSILPSFIYKFKAILFDLDGVIIDSDFLHEEAKKANLIHYHFEITEIDWEKIKHHATSQIYQWLWEHHPDIKFSEKEFMGFKSQYFLKFASSKIKLMPGVLVFIKYLKKRGIRLALVTATRRGSLEVFLNKFNLRSYFEVIIAEDDVKKLKPHPEAYSKAIKLLSLKPKDCLVIEDTKLGVESGKSAGCQVIGKIGTISSDRLIMAGVDGVFNHFHEIC